MHQNKNQNLPLQLTASYLETPLGTMFACVDSTHLYILKFTDQNNIQKSIATLEKAMNLKIVEGSHKLIELLKTELAAYFAGTLKSFSIPVQFHGTEFQQKSWHALIQIPYGRTTSYGQQAIVVGNPKAFRAVANANSQNPITIIVPCHRIIKTNGDLCGYNGGIHRKQALLELEALHRSKNNL